MTDKVACTINLGKKRKSRKISREATIEEVLSLVSKMRDSEESPDYYLEHENAPIQDWRKVVEAHDSTEKKKLIITVKLGLPPKSPGIKRKHENELKRSSKKPRAALPDGVLIRITCGNKTKPRRFAKNLSSSELLALIVEIFPDIVGKNYHLEYLDGYWVNDDED